MAFSVALGCFIVQLLQVIAKSDSMNSYFKTNVLIARWDISPTQQQQVLV
jgi:hypothetical protein